jgi:hypothetical protein
MTNKPLTVFDKPAPTAESIQHSWSDISAEEIADLKIQISRGLGQTKPADDASDELENAVGELGSATNPIGCSSVPACIAYLKRLRTTDGQRILFTRKGCIVDKNVSQHPIDVYALAGTAGRTLRTIYMSGYQPKNSEIAPAFFYLMF